jgi:RNA polymerase sigma-70 factor (ECF subfamily)
VRYTIAGILYTQILDRHGPPGAVLDRNACRVPGTAATDGGEGGTMSVRGDETRFLDLVHRHQRIVGHVCALYARTPDERDDLYQEIVLQLWRSFPGFRGDAKFSTWMYRVALNTALLSRRRGARRIETTTEVDLADAPATAPDRDDDDLRALYAAIRSLPPLDRAIVLLYLEQHTHDEIAAITGLEPKNVGVRIVRIKQRLRERFADPRAAEHAS